jgi:small subunit ribosomal protein S3
MTHTVHPYSHRLGIIRDWKSRWFSPKKGYSHLLKGDVVIREFLAKRLHGMYVSSIEIERNTKVLRVIVETSRPGVVIGRSGEGSVALKKAIESLLIKKSLKDKGQEVVIDIREIRSPESNASIVGQMIVEGLEKRMPFRRVAKQMLEKVMANRDVQGVKVEMSGRLGGAEMGRREKMKKGRVPLQTFRSDIDYAIEEARLPYGTIGVKVWIYRGDVFADKK